MKSVRALAVLCFPCFHLGLIVVLATWSDRVGTPRETALALGLAGVGVDHLDISKALVLVGGARVTAASRARKTVINCGPFGSIR